MPISIAFLPFASAFLPRRRGGSTPIGAAAPNRYAGETGETGETADREPAVLTSAILRNNSASFED